VCIFLCFSHFSQFHPVLMQNQCGDVTMRVLEYESQRAQARKEDMQRRQMRLAELGDACTVEDKKLFNKDDKKYKLQLQKQNKLLHVCLSVLLNLAEEISTERKMVNRKMPHLLIQLLDRSQEDLLLVVLTFLKKLSVFEENKDQIAVPETLSNLVKLAQNPNSRIALLSLRLLFNLSFDERVRGALVESGIIKLLVDLLKHPPFRHSVLRLLYHFSMDERCKSLMAFHGEGMTMLLQLVVHFPEPRVGKDLVALMVNLATNARAAEVIVQSGLFPPIVLRVMKHRDPLLCKVIRHVASHPGVLEQMLDLLASEGVRMAKWMTEFVRMALTSVDNPELLLEVLGTLANVTVEEAFCLWRLCTSVSFSGRFFDMRRRPQSAAGGRVAAKPQFFWALEDVPSALRKEAVKPLAYAHDPTSWLIYRHRSGELTKSELEQLREPGSVLQKALRKPILGRPSSAPQLMGQSKAKAPPRPRPLDPAMKGIGKAAWEEPDRPGSSLSPPKITSFEEKEAQTAKKLGFWPGLPRKQVSSLFPKQVTDLPEVLARMQRLQQEQKAAMETKKESEVVKVKRCKD
ncbi:unnamed protein product, partial [Effrenium voratum]